MVQQEDVTRSGSDRYLGLLIAVAVLAVASAIAAIVCAGAIASARAPGETAADAEAARAAERALTSGASLEPGTELELTIDIGSAMNDVAFWAGTPPDNLLVVIDRDTRSGNERQAGRPASSDRASQSPGRVTVRGVVERVPYREATYSWGLTSHDAALLAERGVYLRAYEVSSAARPGGGREPAGAATAGESDESADQVESTLDVAPRP